MNASEKQYKACDACGSLDVTQDAELEWDADRNEWQIANILDNSDCNKCEGAATLATVDDGADAIRGFLRTVYGKDENTTAANFDVWLASVLSSADADGVLSHPAILLAQRLVNLDAAAIAARPKPVDVELIRNALSGSEDFLNGFEDDESQAPAVPDTLRDIRAAFAELGRLVDERDALLAFAARVRDNLASVDGDDEVSGGDVVDVCVPLVRRARELAP